MRIMLVSNFLRFVSTLVIIGNEIQIMLYFSLKGATRSGEAWISNLPPPKECEGRQDELKL